LPDFNRLRLGGRVRSGEGAREGGRRGGWEGSGHARCPMHQKATRPHSTLTTQLQQDAPATSGSTGVGGAGDGLSSAGTVAVTTVEHDAAIDPVLTGAMENPRERVNVLKYEDAMVQFMKAGTKQQQLELSPCSSYHRLLLYRLAQRFGLEHISGDGEGGGVGMELTINRALVLFKTSQSAMPRLLLIDTCGKEGTNVGSGGGVGGGKAPVMKLMRRSRPAEGQPGGGGGGSRRYGNGEEKSPSSTANGSKSMTDREKAYAEARARIFGAPSESVSSSSSTSTSSAAGPSSSSSPASGLKGVKGAQANGPDASGGFGAGRGKAMAGDPPLGDRRSTTPPYPSQQQQRPEEGRRRSGGGRENGEDGDAGEGGGGGGAKGEWGESKVLWRNREAEKSDPDFVRHHPPHGLPPGGGMMYVPSGGGGGGGGGMYAAMPVNPPYNSLPLPPGAPPGAYYVDPYMQQQMMQQHMAAMYQQQQQQQQQQYHSHHQPQMPFPSSFIPPQGYYNVTGHASSPYSYQGGGGEGGGDGGGGDRGGGERGGGGRGRGRGRGVFFAGGPLPSSYSRGGSKGSETDQRGGEEEFPPLGR